MDSNQKRPVKSPRTRRQKVQTFLSCAILLAILILVYKSWRSSQTLAFGLSGTWVSPHGNFTAVCAGGSWYVSTCEFSAPYAFKGVVQVAPLADGSWSWRPPHDDGRSYLLHHSRGHMSVLDGEQRVRGAKAKVTVYKRGAQAQTGNFWAALKAKSQYIAPLFVLVATYKWVQSAFFGHGLTSTKRRQRLIGRRRAAGPR